MSIKATFLPGGNTSVTTQSLHQWDYGQQLEIESFDLPALVEVHFACQGMTEAIVETCSVADGVGVVTIPTPCLEQTSTITAWVYEINGTCGTTTKTITIPVIARVRPGRTDEVPQDISDSYTELMTAINDAINELKEGTVVAKKAEEADKANYATNAGNAAFASEAMHSTNATKADSANTAEEADYCYTLRSESKGSSPSAIVKTGLYGITAKITAAINTQYYICTGFFLLGYAELSDVIFGPNVTLSFVDQGGEKHPITFQAKKESGTVSIVDVASGDVSFSYEIIDIRRIADFWEAI